MDTKSLQSAYEAAVSYISEVPKFTKKNEAGNTLELMERLGHPERNFRIIHVAGTNGKGSVCAFLSSMLQAGGYQTGLFISPHLVKINERFQINREMISDEMFARSFAKVKAAIDAMVSDGFFHPTYFEILFALGMVAFAQAQIDYLVMETGLGGRLDATNVVEHPAVCIITSISLDHTEYLGDTITAIAGEKAGIIKPGVPVVYDGQNREAEQVIVQTAKERHAPAYPFYAQMAQVTDFREDGLTYVLNNRWYDYRQVRVPFLAEYQVANSALALTALRVLDPEGLISDETALQAVADTRWSGRMELAMPGVVLDGAHNADGIAQFLKTAVRIAQTRPVSLLFAAVVEKDYEEMIREICAATRFTHIVVTQIEGSRKVDAQVFAQVFRRYTDAPVEALADNRQAFYRALERKAPEGVLFCAGSLYLIGEIEAAIAGMTVDAH